MKQQNSLASLQPDCAILMQIRCKLRFRIFTTSSCATTKNKNIGYINAYGHNRITKALKIGTSLEITTGLFMQHHRASKV